MNELWKLHELLSDFDDIDRFSYEFIKPLLHQGLYFKIETTMAHTMIKKDLSGKRIPLVFNLLSHYLFRISSPQFSNVNHNFKIRNNCNKIIVFQDEKIELDIILVDKNKRMGVKIIDFKNLTTMDAISNDLYIDRFFAQHILDSEQVYIHVKIPNFSKTREHYEDQENIFNSRNYYEELINEDRWLNMYSDMIFDGVDSTLLLYERSQMWGYSPEYWRNNMVGKDIFDFAKRNMLPEVLPTKNILVLKEIQVNFRKKNFSNEQLLNKNEHIVEYEKRIKKIMENIKESKNVASKILF